MKRENYYDRTTMEKYQAEGGRRLEQREAISLKLINAARLPDGAKFVDIGCGDGYFLENVWAGPGQKLEMHGGEFSEYQRAIAEKRGPFNISYIDLEENLSYQDAYFDFPYAGEVIEHLYNPDIMMQELSRIVKPGGTVIITTPNMNSWISRVVFMFGLQPINYECSTVSSEYGYAWLKRVKRQSWPVGHVRLFNKHSITDISEANGFEVLKIKGAMFEFIPKSLRWLDKIFSLLPSLSSGLVVALRKI